MENIITYKVTGKYALFTDPLTKIGGEKCSLMVPTYQALKGITESVYWKPSLIWVIDSVRIMRQIKTESKGIRPIKYSGGNDLSMYTYLSDVEYNVKAHFIFNEKRTELKDDMNENKHYFIAKRCIDKGGRRDIYLGARECQGYVEPCCFNEGEGYYDNMGEMEFGFQYHSLSYPDETGIDEIIANFWFPKMTNGVIDFCKPSDCPKRHSVKQMKAKKFNKSNFSGVNETGLLDGFRTQEDV